MQAINGVPSSIKTKLTDEDRDFCDSPITETEILKAIEGLNKKKSPSGDRITAEFFLAFKEELAPVIFLIIRHFDRTNRLPETLTEGIITIFHKNKGPKNNLENYRP